MSVSFDHIHRVVLAAAAAAVATAATLGDRVITNKRGRILSLINSQNTGTDTLVFELYDSPDADGAVLANMLIRINFATASEAPIINSNLHYDNLYIKFNPANLAEALDFVIVYEDTG